MNDSTIPKKKVDWKPHPGPQTEFMRRQEDEVAFGGTKGPGKTDVLLMEGLRQINEPSYRAIIFRRTFPQLREIIDRAKIRFPKYGGVWNGGEKCFTFPSGAKYYMGYCQHEQDKENYQGHEYHYMAFDQVEQFTESMYSYLCMQVRTTDPGIKCYIRSSANPGGVGHWWFKRRFIDGKNAGETHETSFDVPEHGKVTRTSTFIFADHKANPMLSPRYIASLMSLPEAERKAYMEGDWEIFSSQSVFDAHGLTLQEEKISDEMWKGHLIDLRDSIRFDIDVERGLWRIYEVPKDGREYVIGADPSYGDSSGDPASIHICDKRTWNVVATWHGWRDPFEFAKILRIAGLYYCTAEIGVEINGPGISTIQKLEELGYTHLFKYDKDKAGWSTNVKTRHLLITLMQDVIRQSSAEVRDRDTLDEMYNFVRDERSGKISARENCTDDRIISLGIAWQMSKANPFHEESELDPRRNIAVKYSIPGRRRRRR
ncbi:MAG TPA: terminase family protein [Elusimicrobiota bacterium]|nr:terminase family protein [Elusimicrobiota bacterium]